MSQVIFFSKTSELNTVFEKYGYSGNGIGLKNKIVDIDVEISIECNVTSIEYVVNSDVCFPWRH